VIRYETLQCSSFRLHWLRFGLLTVDSVVLYCGLFRFDTLFSVVVLDVVVVECVELHFGSIRRLWFLFCFVLVVCACFVVFCVLFCRARPFRAVACLLARVSVRLGQHTVPCGQQLPTSAVRARPVSVCRSSPCKSALSLLSP